ncbi:hypothetical protein niasHT_027756 [Heterodera trifolii]|uniref:Uncharacterized protein n=1 Tax=Heterodera trifolii TaxID=157864 RepID=A0ABD2KIU1_9BILA
MTVAHLLNISALSCHSSHTNAVLWIVAQSVPFGDWHFLIFLCILLSDCPVTVEKASVENASVEDASVENASVENASVEDASVENASVEDASVENASVENASAEKASVENAPMKILLL